MTLETCNQSDEETWAVQRKDNGKDIWRTQWQRKWQRQRQSSLSTHYVSGMRWTIMHSWILRNSLWVLIFSIRHSLCINVKINIVFELLWAQLWVGLIVPDCKLVVPWLCPIRKWASAQKRKPQNGFICAEKDSDLDFPEKMFPKRRKGYKAVISLYVQH